ncbi:rubrerythrin family protein [Pseudoflavonifractor sp. 524-17]|uniref:rubrerythrin n=1 Tax=Pseudoflavonifractor sp. 524-17 TaxID=2304577 RepID=UPI001379725A|nr:rubrerythrin family protein [Pseudoflavonifractor sp. 524-17]NCE66343.1 rubrerythrin family protein [Pseudoflavonifractor sp. 524-17]
MGVSFESSETRLNLMRAFAGESQARSRYLFAAGLARKQGLHVIEGVFTFTAGQEGAHAKVFYHELGKLCGQTIQVDGAYPVDLYPTVLEHLRAARHNEYQEYEHVYTGFAKTAKEEGFPEISHIFSEIARIEQIHGDRFGRLADLLEEERLFVAEEKISWMCLKCGHVVEGAAAPAVCPVCRHPQGYFVRFELSPYPPNRL